MKQSSDSTDSDSLKPRRNFTRFKSSKFSLLPLLTAVTVLAATSLARAEDSDQFRTYLHWRIGEFAPAWGVLDLRGISYGANVNENWGGELALDYWQLKLKGPAGESSLGEMSIFNLAPQLRFRIPTWNERFVPYVIAGAGGSFIQFNDRTQDGIKYKIEAEGDYTFSAVGGLGFDLFLADNIAFNLEGKYIWTDPITISIDNKDQQWDASSFAATFGLRLFFQENHPRPLITRGEKRRPNRFYFGTQGGFSILTDGDWVDGAKLIPKNAALAGTLNHNYTLSVGNDFGDMLGVEIMLAYTGYALDLPGRGQVGNYVVYTFMPMVRLRFPSSTGKWVPYVMAGVGGDYSDFNKVKPKGQGLHIKSRGFYPALAVGGGIDYFIARNLAFNAEARWRYTWGHDLDVPGIASGSGDFSEVQFTVGFRAYLFDWGKKR